MQRTRKVARNVGATLITQILSFATTFVVLLFLPRYLGADGMGKMTLAFSYAAIFGLLIGFVSGTVLVREIARDPSRLSEMVSTAVVIRIPLCVLMCLTGIGAADLLSRLMGYTPELRELFFIGLVWCSLLMLNDVLSCALRGLEEIPRQNLAAIAEKVANGLVIVFMIWRREPVSYILGASIISQLVSTCILVNGLKRHFRGFVWPTWRAAQSLLQASWPFVTTLLFNTIYGQCDPQLLKMMSRLSVIGWYGIATRLRGTTLSVPVAFSVAMLPTLSRLYREDLALFNHVVQRFVGYMFLLVVPFAAVLIFAPRPVLAILHLGSSFNGAIPVLVILGFSIILWYVSQAAATALIAQDSQAVLSRATGIAAAMAVPVCAVLIWLARRFFWNGAIGAILSDTVVELYLVIAYLRALPRGCVTPREFGVLGKAAIAAVPMVAPLYFLHTAKHMLLLAPLAMAPGLILFLPICYLLGCLGREDIDLVKSALGRRFAGSGEMEIAIERAGAVGADDGSASMNQTAQEQAAAAAQGHLAAMEQLDADPAAAGGSTLGSAA